MQCINGVLIVFERQISAAIHSSDTQPKQRPPCSRLAAKATIFSRGSVLTSARLGTNADAAAAAYQAASASSSKLV